MWKNVPSETDEVPSDQKSAETGSQDALNGSSEDDLALINFVGMKMGDGIDKTTDPGDDSEPKELENNPTNGTPHIDHLAKIDQSKPTKEDMLKRESRAKLSPGRLQTGGDKPHNYPIVTSLHKVQLNINLSENEVNDGTDSGISCLSNCDSKSSESTNDALSTDNNAALETERTDLTNGAGEETKVDSEITLKLSANSSVSNSSKDNLGKLSVSKTLPKARKSVQSSAKTSIKTVNLAPITNRTVKLADLESALKCDKVIESDSMRKDGSEEDLMNNNNDSAGESRTDEKGGMKVKKKRKFKAGNYSFPGQKKKKKYLKKMDDSLDNSCNHSVSSNASLDDMDGYDDRVDNDDIFNSSTECPPKGNTSATDVMAVLSQNSHLAFKAAAKTKITARKKIRTSTSPHAKSVMDMLNSLRKSQNNRQQEDSDAKGNLSDRADTSDSLDGDKHDCIDGEEESVEFRKSLRKRKTQEDTEQCEATTTTIPAEAADSGDTANSLSGKKRKTEEGVECPITPVVTIVSEHQPTPVGLKSLLPRSVTIPTSHPNTDTPTPGFGKSAKYMSSPLALLSSQLAASRSVNTVPKPCGPKNSEALRALLVSGSPSYLPPRGPASITAMPVLGQVKREGNADCFNGEKIVAPHGRETKVASTPNGLCYPVTPPKTPEDGTACDNSSRPPSCPTPKPPAYTYTSAMGISPDKDIIPLCCCKINGASFNKLTSGVTYCQALDSVDGKVMGCCNKVSNNQLVRPAVKIPFMAVCEAHRKRLKLHQCCPGCGHFCTQGKFYQCRKEGGTSVHSFHKLCQVLKDGKYYCPHCGEESAQMEICLGYSDAPQPMAIPENKSSSRRAVYKTKPTFVYPQLKGKENEDTDIVPPVTHTLPSAKTLSSEGLPLGPSRHHLEKMLVSLTEERPKKYRNLSKSMYMPAYEGDLEKLLYMLIDGVDPNYQYEEYDDETALHGAAASGHLAIVHILIQAGAANHMKDKTLKTPLMMAAEHNKPNVVQYLMKVGARVDDRGEDGMTCIHYAAKAGHTEVIKLLLESGKIGPNTQDDGGWTPIIWAAESQLTSTVRFLISQGADPTMKDNEENTGLHWAAYAGSVAITEMFLDSGCEFDTPNEHGDRPLHIAARQNHYESVVLLLARGADVEVRNNNNETPLTCCLDQTSNTWMALKVNKQLKGFAAKLTRPEKLLHRDISYGREKNPIACVNAADDEQFPTDYLYVAENIETSPLNINRVITSLQSCRCKDDCSSQFCVCARSSVKCWFDKFGHLTTDFNLVEPPLLFECNKACRCWTNCNNRVVQNGITCRLQLVRTTGRGWGVKTLTDIPQGTFICEYIGELISDSEADRREDDSYLFDLDNKDGETYCIDARKYGNISRFINHLCEPNVVPVKVFVDHQDLRFPRICFFSSREIKAHEELGFDYGEKFWIIKWKQFTCACQSPKCKYSSETIHKTLQEYRLRHDEEDPNNPDN
ncbi:histone-lysine N-methyltransferase EHMT2-like isoform X4 [Haliotis rufescens]|uniref:histone-lysine N-methyltransferase EHMT2-like isoform X4 n=1 Tax=Haliotis rufescens TaxID=6454 RepID=UPI001EAFA94D|nr:histone-lysine N-methyltransferase EHMT2-like isoform X4 [Haliotis rufescens]